MVVGGGGGGGGMPLVLSENSVFQCNVKKVSIMHDAKGGRFGAYLIRVLQSSPEVTTCAFHRRFSDFFGWRLSSNEVVSTHSIACQRKIYFDGMGMSIWKREELN